MLAEELVLQSCFEEMKPLYLRRELEIMERPGWLVSFFQSWVAYQALEMVTYFQMKVIGWLGNKMENT